MQNPTNAKANMVTFLLFALLFTNCSKDIDLFEELNEYEEITEIDETIDGSSPDAETETAETPDIPNDNGYTNVHPIAEAYYVTVNGSSSNDGKSENTAWNLEHAVRSANAGDVIYVKAGTYNNLRLNFTNSGTADSPIIFMGYKSTPGDIDAQNQVLANAETRGRRGTTVLANGVAYDYKTSPSPEEMPMLSKAYQRDEVAIKIDGDYVEFQNFIISGYSHGVLISSSSSNAKIWNCIFHEQGNMDVSYSNGSHPDRYKGTGIDNRGGQNADIQFNSFLNPEQNALMFQGANSGTVSNNVVYSYNNVNGTDYMFLITNMNGQYSTGLTFEYNKVERVPGVPHGGHGFIVKNGGHGNVFRNWEVLHTNIEVNFTNAYNNTFEKGTLRGGLYDHGDDLTYILITNGAHDNTFKDIVVDGAWGAVVMHDYDDGASNDPNIDGASAGNGNMFINLIGKNCKYGVIFSETGQNSPGGAQNNLFLNCTFYDVEYGIRSYMYNSGNAFYNTSFNTTSGFVTNHAHNLNSNTTFENCHFYGASSPSNVNNYNSASNIGGDPMFSNASSVLDFTFDVSGLDLNSNSPLIGSGQDISRFTDKASKNFEGKTRTSYNIGAF